MIFDAGTILALSMFAVACVALMAGYPVAFTLAGVAIVFARGNRLAKKLNFCRKSALKKALNSLSHEV